MDRTAETGNDETALAACEEFLKPGANSALTLGVARPIHIRGVGKQEQYATLAVIGERVQIEEFVIGRRGIDLKVTGVDDDAKRGGDGQRDGTQDGVSDVDELDLERAQSDALSGLHCVQVCSFEQFMLFQAALDQR